MASTGRLTTPSTILADCLAGDVVRAPVYITGPKVGPMWQVATADAFDAGKMPVVGFIEDKPTATTCVVRLSGELSGFVGLTSGAHVFVGLGVIGHAPVTRPGSGVRHVQVVGVAVSTTEILVKVDDVKIIIRP